jgi:Mg-chelatase subunit ChlD
MSEDARVPVHEGERLRRWRLVLGGGESGAAEGTGVALDSRDRGIDVTLAALYDAPQANAGRGSGRRRAGMLSASAPGVARWLGDIRRYFPTPVVQVMQRDAIERLDLQRLLLEPEMLAAVEPDVHLVSTLLALSHLLPETTRATARAVVGKVVAQLQERLSRPTVQATRGALARSVRTNRPRPADIDWDRTIRANLTRYQPALGTIIPERLVGHARRSSVIRREVVIAVDQSASMGESVVYASVFAAALASVRALQTHLVTFDTSVVDLSEHMHDPVDVLFGIQLGGGTDISRAMAYCQTLVRQPHDTVLVLISDLYDGALHSDFAARLAALAQSGVTVVCLLALSDEGAPSYDHGAARLLANAGIPAFACTPELFPDLIAAAMQRGDLGAWAGQHRLVTR